MRTWNPTVVGEKITGVVVGFDLEEDNKAFFLQVSDGEVIRVDIAGVNLGVWVDVDIEIDDRLEFEYRGEGKKYRWQVYF